MTKTVGTKLKDMRIKQQLTQDELAQQLGVSRQTISKWENDRTLPDINSLLRFCELFDTDLDSLLRGQILTEKEEAPMEKKHFKLLPLALAAALCLLGIGITHSQQQAQQLIQQQEQITYLKEQLPPAKVHLEVYDKHGNQLISEGLYGIQDVFDWEEIEAKAMAVIENTK